ncbi:MAG TPA: sulfite exporter TauE/SafE family protein [Clostridiales bacterium]|nr:sulfite exporter TauE/SafE family protein [Clostridiales bacterium]
MVPEGFGAGFAHCAGASDSLWRREAAAMVDFFLAVLAGLICGVLSGFGIGGGSLLMVWLTALLSMDQRTAQGINLLYFLPAAGCSLIFHVKNRQIVWKAVVPAAIAGCLTAIPGAMLAGSVDTALLRRLFGGFLVLVGISEVFFKGKKTGSSG